MTREIYKNAVDSLKVGMRHFLSEDDYSSRKHAILTIFHSVELFLKEYLQRINPILIYKNIDKKIVADAPTVGLQELFVRLENVGLRFDPSDLRMLSEIQKLRNKIEHHRYDESEADRVTISGALKFITLFVEVRLRENLAEEIDAEMLRTIQRMVLEYREIDALAEWRLEKWYKEQWPNWDPRVEDFPSEFEGTLDCPACGQCYLVVDHVEQPYCFWCNMKVDAELCDECGRTYLAPEGHDCY